MKIWDICGPVKLDSCLYANLSLNESRASIVAKNCGTVRSYRRLYDSYPYKNDQTDLRTITEAQFQPFVYAL